MKHIVKGVVFVLLVAVVLRLFAGSEVSTEPADAVLYRLALEKTRTSLTEAGVRVQLWSTSEALLGKAEKAATAGDYTRATELLEEARKHAELALATAAREKKVWRDNVPGATHRKQ